MVRYILLLFIFNSCSKSPKANIGEIDAIKKVLANQQMYWNNGDIDRFMLGYWNSDKFKFSWVKGIEYGWQNALENLKYPILQRKVWENLVLKY